MEPKAPAPRHATLFLVCSRAQAFGASVKYLALPNHEVYVISRLPLFYTYVERLLATAASVSVVLVCRDVELTVRALALLCRGGSDAAKAAQRAEILEKASHHSAAQSPSRGAVDLCSGFTVAVVCEDDIGDGHLAETTVKTHQVLRYVSLKHGAIYAVVSGISSVADDASSLVSLAEHLLGGSDRTDHQMYSTKGTVVAGSARLHQLISPVRDSWAKIALVAKALPQSTPKDHLLHSEERIEMLDSLYNDHFSAATEQGSDSAAADSTFSRVAELLHLSAAGPAQSPPPEPLPTYREAVCQLQQGGA